MKATGIKFERLFPRGDWQNEKIGIFLELEDGDDPTAGLQYARNFVLEKHKEGVAAEEAYYEGVRRANAPWSVTPAMVEGVPTLREKAAEALRLQVEHDRLGEVAEARRAALEAFGVEINFEKLNEDSIVGVYEGITFSYRGSYFNISIPVDGQDDPDRFSHVRSLEDLGKYIARATPSKATPDDIPF